ncbi:MAG: ATP-binding protein [Armatimonadetes bacterium]|nr:ATP-binding protein [Armatimonadota bacterium]
MHSGRFINREQELAALENAYARDGAEFFVIYGRRRVGKTELIARFCEGKRYVYFEAARLPDGENLAHFVQEIGRALQDPVFSSAVYTEWEPPLQYLARAAQQERLIVVLDEFPYLCEANQALPSLIQRFWDQHGQHSKMFLILCGSSVSFMENEVLAYRSPLYGRRTGQLQLWPLHYRDAAKFVPGYGVEEKLRVYGIAGGMPMYLAQFDDRRSVAHNVKRAILSTGSILYQEVEYLLRSELREPHVYAAILEAIAHGLTRRSEITQRVRQVSEIEKPDQYLRTLEALRLIRRVAPLPSRQLRKPGRGRYFLADNFLRFWYRFVLPNRSRLEMGKVEEVWRENIEPYFDEFMGLVFEEVCREYVRRFGEERLPVRAEEVGVFWHKDGDIDVLSLNADGSVYCGECKWSRQPMDLRALHELEQKAALLPEDWRERGLRFVLFCRGGFADELRRREDGERLILVGLEDLLPEG